MVMKSHKVMKPRHAFTLFGMLKNDLEFVDTQTLRQKIYDQSRFSVLYFILLIGSTLICTLGLLTDNTAIVIGGMLVAPLMWPLARLGYGMANSSATHLYRGAIMLVASILIGAITAYFITSISPIKVLNDEILARTSPTLMDLFIALTAGFVAAIAITQKKVADSLAGVAIAVSLMPPLCTVGIALSLRNVGFSLGALLLFAVNAACITFATMLVLAYNNYVRTKKLRISTRATSINVLIILALAIPLVSFLRTYSFEVASYGAVTSEMADFITTKDAGATFENIEVKRADGSTMSVSADLLIPSDTTFTYEDNEELINRLETRVGKKILLNLKIQGIIEPITKNQTDNEVMINQIRGSFSEELKKLESSFKINTITIQRTTNNEGWSLVADVLVAPDAAPTSQQVSDIAEKLTNQYNEKVDLNLTFVPQLTLRTSEQTISEEIKKLVENTTSSVIPGAEITSFTLTQSGESAKINYTVIAENVQAIGPEYLQLIKTTVSAEIGKDTTVTVRGLQSVTLTL
jgi:uncharacterized hydrophobic protein (TIGR00271 family)